MLAHPTTCPTSRPTSHQPAAAALPAGSRLHGPSRPCLAESYLTQVALGRTLSLRRRLGEPACAVLDVPAAIARQGGSSTPFVAALKAFMSNVAQDQRALLHDADAGLARALGRRAKAMAGLADLLGADLLRWWADTVAGVCVEQQGLVRCAGLHLLWAHVLTSQVISASGSPRAACSGSPMTWPGSAGFSQALGQGFEHQTDAARGAKLAMRDQPDREDHGRHLVQHPDDTGRVAGDLFHHGADAHALAHQRPVGHRMVGVAAEVRFADGQAVLAQVGQELA